jgi:hypothetical protein
LKKEDILSWLYRLLKYNTFEISIPAIRDRNLTCNGKTGLIVSFMAEYQIFKKIKNAGWLVEFVSEIENYYIIDILSSYIIRC